VTYDATYKTLYSQVPNKRGVLETGGRKKFRNLINGEVNISGVEGRNLSNDFTCLYKEGKKKQVVIKHRANIYTEALYFALNIERE